MNTAILQHKLIVPAHLVPLNALDYFKVTIKNDDNEDVDYVYYYLDCQQNAYYFDRGDLGLLYKVFSYLKIEDQRSAPIMNCSSTVTNQGLGLVFTGKLRENQQPVADYLVNGLGYGQLKAHPRFGKTVVMAYTTCKLGLKTLLLSHEISLAKQAYDKFVTYTNCLELEKTLGRKVVGIVEKWEDMLELDVCIMPYQKFVSGKNSKEWLLRLRNQFGMVLIDECFEYSTLVTLADDTQIAIGKLVSMILKGHIFYVKSYNPEKNIWEAKRVSGYSKSRADEDWFKIGLGGSSSVLCSPNHGWYLDGYRKVRADELKIGDRVMVFSDSDVYSLEEITSITRKPIKSKSPMKYNIQVEDNHNYLVGSAKFLVSNCHKLKADTYSFTVSSFNPKYRYGVSGTTELKKNMHLLNHHVLGPVVVEGHGDQLPFSVTTYNTNVSVPIRPSKMFFTMALSYLSNHTERNNFIFDIIEMWLKAGHTIIATSDRTSQCDWFAAKFREKGYTAESYHAKKFKNTNQREELLQRMRSGKTQAMFAMRSMVLGLDIPRATGFFNLLPTAHPENYFQEFCRVRTPFAENGMEKTHSWVIDFRDNHHILKACYKTRRKKYVSENAFSIQDDLRDEDQTYR